MMARRWWILLAVLALAMAGVVTALMWPRSKATPFGEKGIVAVTLELYGPPSGRMAAVGKMDDPGAVRKLTEMLDRGVLTDPHPCIHVGHLSLKRRDGSEFSVEILPGHSADSYEYRYGGVYRRVERGEFLQAIAPLNVPGRAFDEFLGE